MPGRGTRGGNPTQFRDNTSLDRIEALEERYREARREITRLEGAVPPKLFFDDLGTGNVQRLRAGVLHLRLILAHIVYD
jgi:GAF domain-containing protein